MRILYAIFTLFISLSSQGAAPTTPASNLHFNTVDGGFFNLGWTSGNGQRRVIICKAGSPVTFVPQNGSDYAENTNFGSGQQVAPGEYVIYDNAFTSFFLTGLTPATQYFFAVFEYNGSGSATEYLTSSFLTGNATTSATPTIQAGNIGFSNITTNSVTINWTNGNGARRLVVAREGSPVSADPVNSQPYTVNSVFGSGNTIGAGNYAMYNSSGNAVNITNLSAGTQYYFAVYEFNGSSQPQYLTPAATGNIITRSVPTIASSNLAITKTDGKELSLSWTNGNGQRRIIVAKQGSNVTAVPVNGTDYNANGVFGSGQQLAPGEYVVYDDNFNAATISGLNPATTYYFKIFEYDGTGSTTTYLTSSFASVNGSTAMTPSQQANLPAASNVASNSFLLSWANGNGRARLVIGRKNSPVSFVPQDLTAYSGNTDFGQGQDLGGGHYVLAATTDASLNIHQLEANSTYYFAIFEYNGFNQPLYLSPAAVFNMTTSAALPVKLLSWEAVPGERIKLRWKTGSEINASHFIVERSNDGLQFTPVITVAAAGNSQVELAYLAEDPAPLNGKSYYRLKMVDIDGQFEYSPIRTILRSTKQAVQILGNPAHNVLEFVTTYSGRNYSWQIANMAGQVVKKGTVSSGRIEVPIANLPIGKYWLLVNCEGHLESLGFIKN
jgi:hypothetical protein